MSNASKDSKVKAKPAVRKFAKENGVNINDVTPTGPKNTVTKEDIENFMNKAAEPAPAPTPVVQQVQQQVAPPPTPVKGEAFLNFYFSRVINFYFSPEKTFDSPKKFFSLIS